MRFAIAVLLLVGCGSTRQANQARSTPGGEQLERNSQAMLCVGDGHTCWKENGYKTAVPLRLGDFACEKPHRIADLRQGRLCRDSRKMAAEERESVIGLARILKKHLEKAPNKGGTVRMLKRACYAPRESPSRAMMCLLASDLASDPDIAADEAELARLAARACSLNANLCGLDLKVP